MTIPLLTDIFRKKGLKRFASKVRTGMIPLSDIRSAAILMDSLDDDTEACIKDIKDFFRKKGVQPEIRYIDTRSDRKKKGSSLTDPSVTFQKKDLNWYGRLRNASLHYVTEKQYDLYIDLTPRDDYTTLFIAWSIPARFKIGCFKPESSPFNIVVTPPGGASASIREIFRNMTGLLESIR